jgi:ABC-type nickel/cobalt efflux system permease component RcnA
MGSETNILLVTAISLGFVHTLFGPDHYLPFVMLGKANNWKTKKLLIFTVLCGIGHVGSSVLLGFAGIAIGVAVNRLVDIESVRGEIATWFIIAFGFVYLLWGIRKILKSKSHEHEHVHSDGTVHEHTHTHQSSHSHIHATKNQSANKTFWIIFIIFVFGPCEPLIPIIMYPAIQNSLRELILVTISFSAVTIITMTSLVYLLYKGYNSILPASFEVYTHAFAGGIILICGLGMQFLGL